MRERDPRQKYLDRVKEARTHRNEARDEFVKAVQDAYTHGCTVRQIMEAADFASPAAIHRLLADLNK